MAKTAQTTTILEKPLVNEATIGRLPKSWKTIHLNDVNAFSFESGLWTGKTAPFINAQVLRNTNFNNDGTIDYSDIASLQVEERLIPRKQLLPGDILIERSGGGPKQPVGRVVFFPGQKGTFSFSNFTSRLRVLDRQNIDPLFVLYSLLLFHRNGGTLRMQENTTGIRNLKFEIYKQLELPKPPLAEQRAIAAVLSKIQDEAETQRKIVAQLRELKAATMAKLFREGLNGEKLKKTEIGEMPGSWNTARLGAWCEKPRYGYTESATTRPVGPRFLRITDIRESGVDWDDVPYCRCPSTYLHDLRLIPGDIVIARIGATTGKSFLVQSCPNAVFASYLIRLRVKAGLDSGYLSFFLQSEFYWKQIDAAKGNNLKGGVNAPILSELVLPLPLIEEQQQIAHVLAKLDGHISTHEKYQTEINSFFSSTLQLLMAGRIRVSKEVE
jgi:type I restriction enzyme S subunit